MRTDFEEAVAASMRSIAEREVDVHGLAARAVARARILRRRRRLGSAAVAAAVAVVVAVALGRLPGPDGNGVRPAGPASSPGPARLSPPPPGGYAVPALPLAVGVPGAKQSPSLVGADPATLHFDLGPLAASAYQAAWTTGTGYESVELLLPSQVTLRVSVGPQMARLDEMARSLMFPPPYLLNATPGRAEPTTSANAPPPTTVPTTVDGRPATLEQQASRGQEYGRWILRWQPVDGLWVRADAISTSAQDVLALAGALRLDRSRRCVSPVQLTPTQLTLTPPPLHWTGCTVALAGYSPARPWTTTTLTFFTDSGAAIVVRLQPDPQIPAVASPNLVIAGHQARWSGDKAGFLELPNLDGVRIEVSGGSAEAQGLTREDALGLLDGVHGGADLTRPESWPVPAVT